MRHGFGIQCTKCPPAKQEALGLQGQKYHKFYNPLSTIIQTGFRAGGGPINLTDRTQPNLGLFGDEYPLFNPNATPGPNKDPQSIITNLLNDGMSLEDFGDGSPLGIRSLLDTELGNFQPQNFDLPQEERPRFGPFRPQSSELDNLTAPAREKIDDLKQQAEKFTGCVHQGKGCHRPLAWKTQYRNLPGPV